MAEIVSRITVTGTSGFLGRWLIARARELDMDAREVTRGPAADTNSHVRVDDYRQTPPPRGPSEVLVHLAQPNRLDLAVDVDEAIAVVDHLTRQGYRRVCYASSAAVYGDKSMQAHRPNETVTAHSGYASMKLECEGRVLAAGGTVIRLTNLYGPGQSDASVLSRILQQIPGTGPLLVRTVSPVRDFCWVGDAAQAVLDLAAGRVSGIFNVGQGKSLSIGDLASTALEVAGEAGRSVEPEVPDGLPSVLAVDISETSKACGWVPHMSLADGIRRIMMDSK